MYRAVAVNDREFQEDRVPIAALPLIPGIPERRCRQAAGCKDVEIEIPLKRLIHVRGVVREKGTGKPIEGVGI